MTTTSHQNHPRRIGLTLLRVAIGIGLLVYLFSRFDLSTLKHVLSFQSAQWWWLIAGIIFTFTGLCLGALRWNIILASQHIRLTYWKTFYVFFIGQFFNAFMLGACGGDIARAYYATRECPEHRTEAATTVFIDRAIGLFVTILVACCMIIYHLPYFLQGTSARWSAIAMLLFLITALLAFFILFHRNRFEQWKLLRHLEHRTRFGSLIRKAYDSFYLFKRNHRILVISTLTSMGNLLFLTLACYAFGHSLLIDVPFGTYLTFFPIITVMSAIPITPGSFGVRETLFVTFFQSVQIDPTQGLLLSLFTYAGGLFWSLFGGVLFLLGSRGGSDRSDLLD